MADSQPGIRVQLRQMPPNGNGPRLAKWKRTLAPVKEAAQHSIRVQPADKKRGIAPNRPSTKRFHDGKTKVYAPRQKSKAGSASSLPGIKNRHSSIRQKRTIKVVARSVKLSRSAGQGTSEAENHSTQQRQRLQAVIQGRRSIQWSRAAAQMNLRMVKLLIRAVALLVKGLSAMLGISSSVIILLCIIMIFEARLSSPFGIFVADENTGPDTKKLVQIVEEMDAQFANKQLSKVKHEIQALEQKRSNLIDLHLDEKIDRSTYEHKYDELESTLTELIEVREQLEASAQEEIDVEKRLQQFRNVLQSNTVLSEFDRNVFESVIEKVIMGEEQEDGSVEPYQLTFVFKTGLKRSIQGKSGMKSPKTLAAERNDACPHIPDNTCGMLCTATSKVEY
ncbi:hypothetical protein D3C74_198760 [compost metagenome]